MSLTTPTRRIQVTALAVTLLTLAAYAMTLNRTFGVIDAGELAACAYTLGTPHQTGYPTMMTLGYVATHISPLRPILTLNILSAILTACSAGALTFLLHYLLVRLYPSNSSSQWMYAGLGAFAIGITDTWWNQGIGFEVYSLHALMIALVLLLFLKYVDDEVDALRTKAARGFTRRGFMFAFVLGLSFTNHMTTGLLAPGLLLYYFWTLTAAPHANAKNRPGTAARAMSSLQRLLYLVPAFLLGLVPPYAWMMIRAGMNPRFNWGAPSTFENLAYHITGKDYSGAMWHAFDRKFEQQFVYFTNTIPPAVGYVGLLLGALGLGLLLKKSPKLAAASILIFVTSVAYACGYDVNDIGNYFMHAVLMIGVWAAVAVYFLHERFGRRVGLPVALLLAGATLYINYPVNNDRDNTITEDFTRNMLESLPKGAIVITKQWDFWEAGSYYLQEVEGVRKDVMVIDGELLHSDWYVDQLTRAYPTVMSTVTDESSRFKVCAIQQRRGELLSPSDSANYFAAYSALVNGIIDRNIASNPCFVTFDPFDADIAPNYFRVPYQLALRLVKDTTYVATDFPTYKFTMWRDRILPQTIWTLKLYALACVNRARYERDQLHHAEASRYAELAAKFDPRIDERDVPDFPVHIESQVIDDLRRLKAVRQKVEAGEFPYWNE